MGLYKFKMLLFIPFLFCSVQVLAKIVSPFALLGKQVENYNDIIGPDKIKPGDIIQIKSTNDRFLVKKYLNSGGTTIIFKVIDLSDSDKKEYALRLPKKKGRATLKTALNFLTISYDYDHYLTTYITGFEKLKKLTNRIVRIHKAKKGQYILVDLIGKHFTLNQYIDSKHLRLKNINDDEVLDGLRQFIKETISISYVKDIHLDQIVYDTQNKRWILMDWADDVLVKKKLNHESYFLSIPLSKKIVLRNVSNAAVEKIDLTRRIIEDETQLAIKIEDDMISSLKKKLLKVKRTKDILDIIAGIPSNLSTNTTKILEEQILSHLQHRNYSFENETEKLKSILNNPLMNLVSVKDYFKANHLNVFNCKALYKFFFEAK